VTNFSNRSIGKNLTNVSGYHGSQYLFFVCFAGNVIIQEIDPKVPIGELREILGKRMKNSDLSKHDIYIQQVVLDPTLSLYEQGVKVGSEKSW